MKTTISFLLFIVICVLPGITNAQLVTISGSITNAFTGMAIENVSVFEKCTDIGTISNKDGFFKLMLHPGRLNLTFSENGFKTISENLVLKSDTTLVIHLKPEISAKNRHHIEQLLQAGIDKKKNLKEEKHFPK